MTTKASLIDLNGNEMILDADADTKIDAATDDEIHFTVAGSETVYMGVTSYNASDRIVLTNTAGNASATIVGSTSGESSIFMADGTSGDASYRGYVQYQHTNDNMNFGTGGTERMRIISDGKVGISTTSPLYELDVNGESHIRTRLFVGDGTASSPSIRFYNASTGLYYPGSDGLGFVASGTEYMRLTLNGDFAIGSVTSNSNNVADASSGNGFCYSANANRDFLAVTRDSGVVVYLNRIGNGDVLAIRKNGSTKGTISVNDATVSYNPFMGSHYSETSDSEILLGTVMEYTGELVENYNIEEKRLSKVKISDTSESTKVYGIYFADGDELGGDLIAGLGASWCRINKDVTVQLGDLLVSNGDGTAKVQSDDIIRSKTIGKVTSTTVKETYSDGSYVVPVVLYCG